MTVAQTLRRIPVSALLLTWCAVAAAAQPPLVLYSAQKEPFIRPMLDAFTAQTGIDVEVLSDQGPVLVERLAAEGTDSRADVLLTVDVGNLTNAVARDLLRPMDSSVLTANIPPALRDQEMRWVGLSRRGRALVYAPSRVDPAQLSTYAALAQPQWKGRLCLRTSKNVYNQSLVAWMLTMAEPDEVENTVRGWVENLATAPLPDDTMAIRAVATGDCDVAVVNMYYLARLKRDDAQYPAAVFWPDQDDGGSHINILGAGVTAASKQPQAAQRLLEWWSGEAAQALLASNNLEYPANLKVAPDPILAAFGPFQASDVPLAEIGQRQADAVRLMDRAGWR